MIRKGFVAGAAAWLALSGAAAQAQAPINVCIEPPEAEGLALVLAPLAMREVATFCAPQLPANAYLRHSGPLIAKLDAAAANAAPGAQGAITKLMGGRGSGFLSVDQLMPAINAMVAPMLRKELKPGQCGTYDRIAGLLDPMPAENTAALLVTIVQLSQKDKPDSKLPICPLPKAN